MTCGDNTGWQETQQEWHIVTRLVSPMISGEMPMRAASREAPRTRASAPTINSTSPATNAAMVMLHTPDRRRPAATMAAA